MKTAHRTLLPVALALLCLAPVAHSTSPPTLILGAFPEEVAWLKTQLADTQSVTYLDRPFTAGTLEGQPVVVGVTGVGKVNAAMTAGVLIDRLRPARVIFTGVAGSLNPDLAPGDVVIGRQTIQHDLGEFLADSIDNWGVRNPANWEHNPTFLPADSLLLAWTLAMADTLRLPPVPESPVSRLPRMTAGIIATGDGFCTSTPLKRAIRRRLHADAVEMEGAAVAQVCYQWGVPCLVLRALSDNADENANADFERYYQAAADNANRLVLALLARLQQEAQSRRTYRDSRWGFQFEYPQACSLRVTSDPQGGLVRAVLSEAEGDRVLLDLDLLDSYPPGSLGPDTSWAARAEVLARRRCEAGGPGGGQYCAGVTRAKPFANAAGVPGVAFLLALAREDHSSGRSSLLSRGPVYALCLETAAGRLLLFVEAVDGSGAAGADYARLLAHSLARP
ncbi:MAG: 5'-methylthioadenosine/adenosylhomocysteine nucleosidase [Candidatus Zixiibacteriota bacterium]|nr:MAG: 5'-methylthioadenosine/adenosylhomocysteine nucleosidase [candidate division Zixibacteria bacterium]